MRPVFDLGRESRTIVLLAAYLGVGLGLYALSGWLTRQFGTETGLTRSFYEGQAGESSLLFSVVVPYVSLAFLDERPDLPRRFITVRWEGFWHVTTARIDLYAGGDDFVEVEIDGEVVLGRDEARGMGTESRALTLEPGLHRVAVDYRQYGGGYSLGVSWSPSGESPRAFDPTALFPVKPSQRHILVNRSLRVFSRLATAFWLVPFFVVPLLPRVRRTLGNLGRAALQSVRATSAMSGGEAYLLILLGTLGLTLIHSPGTGDVTVWRQWAETARLQGLVDGYRAVADYPPVALVLLAAIDRMSIGSGIDFFLGLKISLFFSLLATSYLVYRWTRDVLIVALLYSALLLNVLGLGYIDIYFVLPLVASLWAFERQRPFLATVLFTAAWLVKFQPLVVAPFVALYLFGMARKDGVSRSGWHGLVYFSAVPLLALAICVSVFGLDAIVQAFDRATSHTRLSAYALNANWVVQHGLHVFASDEFGPLVDGRSTMFRTTDWRIAYPARLLLYLSYGLTLVAFAYEKKSFENLTRFSFIGFFCYFMFNIGVHENHLVLACVLAFLVAWKDRTYLPTAIAIAAMLNVNMWMFYGSDGTRLGFSRVVGVDLALVWALLNCALFGAVFTPVVRVGQRHFRTYYASR